MTARLIKAIGMGVQGQCTYPLCAHEATWEVEVEALGIMLLCREHYRETFSWNCPECETVNVGVSQRCEKCYWLRPGTCASCGEEVSAVLMKVAQKLCSWEKADCKELALSGSLFCKVHEEMTDPEGREPRSASLRWGRRGPIGSTDRVYLNDVDSIFRERLAPYLGKYVCFLCANPEVIVHRPRMDDPCPACNGDKQANGDCYACEGAGIMLRKCNAKKKCAACAGKREVETGEDAVCPECLGDRKRACVTCLGRRTVKKDPVLEMCRPCLGAGEVACEEILNHHNDKTCHAHTDRSHCPTCKDKAMDEARREAEQRGEDPDAIDPTSLKVRKLRIDEPGPFCSDHAKCIRYPDCKQPQAAGSLLCDEHRTVKGLGSTIQRQRKFENPAQIVELRQRIRNYFNSTRKRFAGAVERVARFEDEIRRSVDQIVYLEMFQKDLNLSTREDQIQYELSKAKILGMRQEIDKSRRKLALAKEVASQTGVVHFDLLLLLKRISTTYADLDGSSSLHTPRSLSLAETAVIYNPPVKIINEPDKFCCEICGRPVKRVHKLGWWKVRRPDGTFDKASGEIQTVELRRVVRPVVLERTGGSVSEKEQEERYVTINYAMLRTKCAGEGFCPYHTLPYSLGDMYPKAKTEVIKLYVVDRTINVEREITMHRADGSIIEVVKQREHPVRLASEHAVTKPAFDIDTIFNQPRYVRCACEVPCGSPLHLVPPKSKKEGPEQKEIEKKELENEERKKLYFACDECASRTYLRDEEERCAAREMMERKESIRKWSVYQVERSFEPVRERFETPEFQKECDKKFRREEVDRIFGIGRRKKDK